MVREFGRCPDWLREERVEDRAAVSQLILRGLDWGEVEAIVLANGLLNVVLPIDEARGRKAAVGAGLAIIGTTGLLAVTKYAGLLPAVKLILDPLVEVHDFRFSRPHCEAVLREASEA